MKQRNRSWLLLLLMMALGCVVLFGSTLAGRDRLAFRDVSHFYAPLYEYVGDRTAAGVLPLWNPLDHTGGPLAGETTTAMFYPPRLLFVLPIPSSVAMGLYVVGHLMLASLGGYWAARKSGCFPATATFAGVAYGFACPVVFLYCNPPFLVGAAWLPLLTAVGLHLLRSLDARSVAAAGFVFAMPVLAGDPQTPVHVAVWLGIVFAFRKIQVLRRRSFKGRVRITPLLLAIGAATVVALPQVAASLDWAGHSTRRLESPAGVYDFGIAPWQWLDCVVPLANGQLFPSYQRLGALIPGDSRVWSVSLYGGLLVFVLAACRILRRRRLDAWDALIPLGMLMAMGHFGPMWLAQWIGHWCGADSNGAFLSADPALGSPYWLLKTFLPGYGSFRYPAKWLPLVSLGMAIAAGRHLEHVCRLRRPPFRTLIGLALVLGIGSLGMSMLPVPDWIAKANLLDAYWGPLDPAAAFADLAYGLRHAAGFATAFVLLLWILRVQRDASRSRYVHLVTGLLLLDLVVVNRPLIATVERQQEAAWETQFGVPPGDGRVQDDGVAEAGSKTRQAFLRTGNSSPSVWHRGGGRGRVQEVAASERIGLQGRWHLISNHRVFNSATSITPQRYRALMQAAEQATQASTVVQQQWFWQQLSIDWGLTGYLHTSSDALPAFFENGQPARLMDTRALLLETTRPQVRLHSRWRTILPRPVVRSEDWSDYLAGVQDAAGERMVVVESSATVPLTEAVKGQVAASEIIAAVDDRGGDRERITVRLNSANLLSRRTFQDGHWHCRYRTLVSAESGSTESGSPESGSTDAARWQHAVVMPVDYLAQGVLLPAGEWEVEFWYRPWWWYPSLVVAILGMLCLLFVACRQKESEGDGC